MKPMRTETELASIVQAIRSVAFPAEPEPSKRSLFWMPPETRRAFNLAMYGRGDRLAEMARALAEAARTPAWVARMALDAVYLPGREADLDNAENDPPALELALMAMGINPAAVTWADTVRH